MQRILAEAGVAARRVCERLIEEGHVQVNGKIANKLPVFVDPDHDHIEVDGRPIARKKSARPRLLYIMVNKPARTLTTASEEPGDERTTIFDLVDYPGKPRLFAVGRLDYETTGLVLLTNDGTMANVMTHPRYGVPKTYEAVVKGLPDQISLAKLEKDIHKAALRAAEEEGSSHAPRVELKITKRDSEKTMIELTFREGKNPQVRRMLAIAGWPVKKLTHIRLGPLELRALALGKWRELERDELAALKKTAAALTKGGKNRQGGKPPTGTKAPEAPLVPAGPIITTRSRASLRSEKRSISVGSADDIRGRGPSEPIKNKPRRLDPPPSHHPRPGGRFSSRT